MPDTKPFEFTDFTPPEVSATKSNLQEFTDFVPPEAQSKVSDAPPAQSPFSSEPGLAEDSVTQRRTAEAMLPNEFLPEAQRTKLGVTDLVAQPERELKPGEADFFSDGPSKPAIPAPKFTEHPFDYLADAAKNAGKAFISTGKTAMAETGLAIMDQGKGVNEWLKTISSNPSWQKSFNEDDKDIDENIKALHKYKDSADKMSGKPGEFIGSMVPFAAMAAGSILAKSPSLALASTTLFAEMGYGAGIEAYDEHKNATKQPIDEAERTGAGILYGAAMSVPMTGYIGKMMPKGLFQKAMGQSLGANPEAVAGLGKEIFEAFAKKSPGLAKQLLATTAKGAGHGVAAMEAMELSKRAVDQFLIGRNVKPAEWWDTITGAAASGAVFGMMTAPFSMYAQNSTTAQRREYQGSVTLSKDANGNPVEIIPTRDGKQQGMTPDGKIVDVTDRQIKDSFTIPTIQFNEAINHFKKSGEVSPTIERDAYSGRITQMTDRLSDKNGNISVATDAQGNNFYVVGSDGKGGLMAVDSNGQTGTLDPGLKIETVNKGNVWDRLMSKYDTQQAPKAEQATQQSINAPILNPRQQAEQNLRDFHATHADKDTGMLRVIGQATPDGENTKNWFIIKEVDGGEGNQFYIVEDGEGGYESLTKAQATGQVQGINVDDYVAKGLTGFDQKEAGKVQAEQNQMTYNGETLTRIPDDGGKGSKNEVWETQDGRYVEVPNESVAAWEKSKQSDLNSSPDIVNTTYGKIQVVGAKDQSGNIVVSEPMTTDQASQLKSEVERTTGGKTTIESVLNQKNGPAEPDSYQVTIIPAPVVAPVIQTKVNEEIKPLYPLDAEGSPDIDNMDDAQLFNYNKEEFGDETAIASLNKGVRLKGEKIASLEKKLDTLEGKDEAKARKEIKDLKEQKAKLELLIPDVLLSSEKSLTNNIQETEGPSAGQSVPDASTPELVAEIEPSAPVEIAPVLSPQDEAITQELQSKGLTIKEVPRSDGSTRIAIYSGANSILSTGNTLQEAYDKAKTIKPELFTVKQDQKPELSGKTGELNVDTSIKNKGISIPIELLIPTEGHTKENTIDRHKARFPNEPIHVEFDDKGRLTIEDGNHRYFEAIQRGDKTINVVFGTQQSRQEKERQEKYLPTLLTKIQANDQQGKTSTTGPDNQQAGEQGAVNSDSGVAGEGKGEEKPKVKRTKQLSKIQQEAYNLETSPTDVHSIVLKHFIAGGKINKSALEELFGNKSGKSVESERRARFTWTSKDGQSISEISHSLWENHGHNANGEPFTDMSDQDFRDAVESVIRDYISPVQMANDLIKTHKEKSEQYSDEDVAEMEKMGILGTPLSEEDISFVDEQSSSDEEYLQSLNEYYDLSPEEQTELNNIYNEGTYEGTETSTGIESPEPGSNQEGERTAGKEEVKPKEPTVYQKQIDTLTAERSKLVAERKKKDASLNSRNGLFGDVQQSPNDMFAGEGFDASQIPQALKKYDDQIAAIDTQVERLKQLDKTGQKEVKGQKDLVIPEEGKPIGIDNQIEDTLSGQTEQQKQEVDDKIKFTTENSFRIAKINGSNVYDVVINEGDVKYNLKRTGKLTNQKYYYPIQYANIEYFSTENTSIVPAKPLLDVIADGKKEADSKKAERIAEAEKNISEVATQYGWTIAKNPAGDFELSNRNGKMVATVKLKNGSYTVFRVDGDKLLSGSNAVEIGVEKVIKDYFYGKKEAVVIPEVKVGKEPWEMTQGEFLESEQKTWWLYSKVDKHNEKSGLTTVKYELKQPIDIGDKIFASTVIEEVERATKKGQKEIAIGLHKQSIEQAISEGKPIPENVLADYPSLKPKSIPESEDQYIFTKIYKKPVFIEELGQYETQVTYGNSTKAFYSNTPDVNWPKSFKDDAAVDAFKAKLSEENKGPKNPNWEFGGEKQKKDFGKENKVFTESAREEALRRIKERKSRLSSGWDPTALVDYTIVAGYHIEGGARKFIDFAKNMIVDLGPEVKPYLGSLYESIRRHPEMKEYKKDLDNTEYVDNFDIDNFNPNEDVHDKSGDSKPDSENPTNEIQGNEKPVSNGRSTSGRVRGQSSKGNNKSGRRDGSPRSGGLFTDLFGESSDNELHQPDGQHDAPVDDAGDTDGRGSSNDSADGLSNERGTNGTDGQNNQTAAGSFAERTAKKLIQQKAAENIQVVTGDIDNIRETLPLLLSEQQDDVFKAETRFFSPTHQTAELANGKGMLFTNGTGTGKTYTGLGIIKRFVKQGKTNVLIVVPSEAKVNDWANDGKNLGLNIVPLPNTTTGGTGQVVTTYANFRDNQELLKREFDLVVYDESHRIMEEKNGATSSTTTSHYAISNKDLNSALGRLKDVHPVWLEQKSLFPAYTQANVNLNVNDDLMDFQFAEAQAEIKKMGARLDYLEGQMKLLEPGLIEQAKQAVSRTKVVFLSATPFKGHFNLRYANGVLFNWGEEITMQGRSRVNSEARFFLDNFGAAYEWRYHKLNARRNSNADAVAMQEIQFAQKLMSQGVMSGRAIESDKDYSREFPLVALEQAEVFNKALNEIYSEEYDGLRTAARTVFSDYNYTTKLFESLKASMSISRIQDHLDLGRKVIIFHRRKQSNVLPPFQQILDQTPEITKHKYTTELAYAVLSKNETAIQEATERYSKTLSQIADFKSRYADLLRYEKTLNYNPAIDQIQAAFPGRVVTMNGDTAKKDKSGNVKLFNDDNSGKDIFIVQEEAGKEGISLHDTTGKHQRVLMSLSLPISSTTTLQIEGRPYRIGNESDAIFEYPLLGLDQEIIDFGSKVNKKLSTTENLAIGDQARDLLRSFAEGVLFNSGTDRPNSTQGKGGKEYDKKAAQNLSVFRKAVLVYNTNQKTTGKRDERDGVDYYATPEPVGQKMVEWLDLKPEDSAMEPSAGHGAIAMWFPEYVNSTSIEPSYKLFSKLNARAGGGTRKFVNDTFENFNVINKYNGIAMNPPFGSAGKTAMDHVEKAFSHLKEGGRVVALVPTGGMDKRVEKFLFGVDDKGKLLNPDAHLIASIGMPSITFAQAGTSVGTRIIVIDKITLKSEQQFRNELGTENGKNYLSGKSILSQDEIISEARKRHNEQNDRISQPINIDLRDSKTIDELFDSIEDIEIPKTIRTEQAHDRSVPLMDVLASGKAEVSAAKESSGVKLMPVEEFKHTQTGQILYNVKINGRSDDYSDMSQIAKKHKPYTSSKPWNRYSKGFLFNAKDDAIRFKNEIEGNQDPMYSIIGERGAANIEGLIDNLTTAKAMTEDMSAQSDIIKDENGNPRVFYHGTNNTFSEFDISRTGENTQSNGFIGNGLYFTTNKNDALNYGKNVMEVSLVSKKQLDVNVSPEELLKQLPGLSKDGVTLKEYFDEKAEILKNIEYAGFVEDRGVETDFIVEYDGKSYFQRRAKQDYPNVSKEELTEMVVKKILDDLGYPSFENTGAVGNFYGAQNITNEAKKEGFDSIISDGTNFFDAGKEIVVFDKKQVASKPITKETIYLATGWEKFKDGWKYDLIEPDEYVNGRGWTYKLDDINPQRLRSILSTNEGKPTLQQVFDAPDLYKAYPELKGYGVGVIDNSQTGGYFDSKTETIYININNWYKDAGKSTLIHEIQHAIQHLEGFAKGGNLEMFSESRKNTQRLFKDLTDVFDKLGYDNWLINNINEQTYREILNDNRNFAGMYAFAETFSDATKNKMIAKLNEANKVIRENDQIFGKHSRYDSIKDEQLYKALAGEVEARNAQTRLDLASEQRKEQLISATQDVAEDQKVYLMDAIDNAYSTGPVTQSIIDTAQAAVNEIDNSFNTQGEIIFMNGKDVLDDINNRGLMVKHPEDIADDNWNGVTIDGKIYINPRVSGQLNMLPQVVLHEKVHTYFAKQFLTKKKKERFFDSVYNVVGRNEIEKILPVFYHKLDNCRQGEEYVAHIIEGFAEAFRRFPSKSIDQVTNLVLSKVSNSQVKTLILDAVNDIINLKSLQNVVISSNRTDSNNSGEQSVTGKQGRPDKNSTRSSGLDPGAESDVQFGRRGLGQESSTDSGNTTQRTENLDGPKNGRLNLLELLAEAKKERLEAKSGKQTQPTVADASFARATPLLNVLQKARNAMQENKSMKPKRKDFPDRKTFAEALQVWRDAKKSIIDADLEEVRDIYDSIENDWFGNTDIEIAKSDIDTANFQDKIKESNKNAPGNVNSWHDIDEAMKVYIDLKRDPSSIARNYDKLTDEQKRIVDIAQQLTPEQVKIANDINTKGRELGLRAFQEGVITNSIEDHVNRAWDMSSKNGQEFAKGFRTSTGHSKQRTLPTILDGWAEGLEMKTKGATNSLQSLRVEIHTVIENRKLMDLGLITQSPNGVPLFITYPQSGYRAIEHPNFRKWRKVKTVDTTHDYRGENYSIDKDGNVFEKLKVYAPEDIAKRLNNVLGESQLGKYLPFIKGITKFNAIAKSTILSYSFFHHQAFSRSYLLAGALQGPSDANVVRAYKAGLEMFRAMTPEVEILIRNGLTTGRIQDWEESLIDQRNFIDDICSKTKATDYVRAKIRGLHEAHTNFLFKEYGAGLKVKTAVLEYHHQIKAYPGEDPNTVARRVADLVNDDFGGLHLKRMGRNPTLQHLLRLVLLAPDWTESNVRTLTRAFTWNYSEDKAPSPEQKAKENKVYRMFWVRALLRTAIASTMWNLAMAFFNDPDDEESYWETVLRMYKEQIEPVMNFDLEDKSFMEGFKAIRSLAIKAHFLDADITPLVRAFNSDMPKEGRFYFATAGHFKDPIKWFIDPTTSLKHKSSVIMKLGIEAYTAENWQDKRFTSVDELLGIDNKGMFTTTSKINDYKVGEAKGGKLAGEFVKYGSSEDKGAIQVDEMPSYALAQMKGLLPVPIQNIVSYLQGETDGFTMMTRGIGFNTSKETIKGYDYAKKAKELLKNADVYLKVREDAKKTKDSELSSEVNNQEWLKTSNKIHNYYLPKINRYTNGFSQNGIHYGGLKYWTEKNNEEKIILFQKKLDDLNKKMVNEFKDVKFPASYR